MDVNRCHIIMTDERLDYLATRFVNLMVRERVHVTFEQYLRDPAHYDAQACQEVARQLARMARVDAEVVRVAA